MKNSNGFRRLLAAFAIGWVIADSQSPKHFTSLDGIMLTLAIGVYVMTFFIKEP